jgi:hypothetical protein
MIDKEADGLRPVGTAGVQPRGFYIAHPRGWQRSWIAFSRLCSTCV